MAVVSGACWQILRKKVVALESEMSESVSICVMLTGRGYLVASVSLSS